MFKYFAIYKPFNMLSQFTREGNNQSLADFPFKFPIDVYPVGRLDADSEGLLLLTNDKRVNNNLLNPLKEHKRTYLVQVEGEMTEQAINKLEPGIILTDKSIKYKTLPAKVTIIKEPELPERNPPIRIRKNIPTSWIEIALIEGKNRQVRKMTAAAGFPALRLIRSEIENFRLQKMENSWVEEVRKSDFYMKLKLSL